MWVMLLMEHIYFFLIVSPDQHSFARRKVLSPMKYDLTTMIHGIIL